MPIAFKRKAWGKRWDVTPCHPNHTGAILPCCVARAAVGPVCRTPLEVRTGSAARLEGLCLCGWPPKKGSLWSTLADSPLNTPLPQGQMKRSPECWWSIHSERTSHSEINSPAQSWSWGKTPPGESALSQSPEALTERQTGPEEGPSWEQSHWQRTERDRGVGQRQRRGLMTSVKQYCINKQTLYSKG